jgi:uncharacterized damage-inducible protein DinB
MNADAFRHFFNYHFAENRSLWERYVAPLPGDLFIQPAGYSHGSVRGQVVHIMSTDEVWFAGLRGATFPEDFPPVMGDDRDAIRARWDAVEEMMREYLAGLTEEILVSTPIEEPEEDRDLKVWQVLLHVVNHGTDHRAQLLRLLNDLGVDTKSQDYIFYAYENP